VVADAEPSATISGQPDQLMLWLWGRASLDQVTVDGDRNSVVRLREICSI
jgi:hypothetical protein